MSVQAQVERVDFYLGSGLPRFHPCYPAGDALWAEVGGGIIFVTPGEFAGQRKKLPVKFVMVYVRFKGHPGEIAGKNKVRPLFLLIRFFCLVGIQRCGFGVWFFVFMDRES